MFKLLVVIFLLMPAYGFGMDSYTPQQCPVVGNSNSRIFHVPGNMSYGKMLVRNKSGADNRVCFSSVEEAKKNNYRAALR